MDELLLYHRMQVDFSCLVPDSVLFIQREDYLHSNQKGSKMNIFYLMLLYFVIVTIMRAARVSTNAALGVVTPVFSWLFKE